MRKVLGSLVLASTFVLTACGGGDSDSSSDTKPAKVDTTKYANEFTKDHACKVTDNVIRVPKDDVGCAYQHKDLTAGEMVVYACGAEDKVLSTEGEEKVIANAKNGKDFVFDGDVLTVTCQAQ